MNFEERIVQRTVNIFSIVLPVLTLITLFINTDIKYTLFTGFSSILFACLCFIQKKKTYFKTIRLILSIFMFFALNMAWYFLNGVRGPVISGSIVFVALFVFIWEDKYPFIFYGLLVLNVIVFVVIEATGLIDFIPSNNSFKGENYFIYFGASMSSLLILVISYTVRNLYINQYQKARQSDDLKTAFLANISHEIRTPLNAISGFSELIAISENKESKENYAEIIKANTDHLIRLIDDILDISVLESGIFDYLPEKIHLIDFLRSVTLLAESKLLIMEKEDLKIKSSFELENPIIVSDPVRLKQILINLIINAIKYTNRGEILIKIKEEKNAYKFLVRDTGLGIREENFKYLFKRFYKITKGTKKLYRGTGLGLYLCKQMTEKMGGKIGFESVYKEGSTFWFTIPKKVIPKKAL